MSFKQDLFWINLPSNKLQRKKIDSFTHTVFRSTFLKYYTDYTIFLFTGTNKIDIDFLFQEDKLLKKLSKKKVEFFLYEPVSYYFEKSKHTLGYYTEFHSRYNHSSRLKAEELDSINELGKHIGGINLNHCDYKLGYYLNKQYPFINFKCRDIFIRHVAVGNHYNRNKKPKIIKKFWCGNGRYTIHRHLVMCYLVDKPGNYSWWYKCDADWDAYIDWVGDLPIQYLSKNNTLLNKQKLELDFSNQKVEIHNKTHYHQIKNQFTLNHSYEKTFDECFVCVINETRFAQPTGNFSEKVLHAINYSKPFILVAPPFTLEYIKKLGFKTFDRYWDESYDNIKNHSKRMLAIFNLIDYINSKSIKELNEIYTDMQEIIVHNHKMLQKLPLNNETIDDT